MERKGIENLGKFKFQTEGAFSAAFTGWRWGTTSCNLTSNAALGISILLAGRRGQLFLVCNFVDKLASENEKSANSAFI